MDKFRVGQKVLTRIPPNWGWPVDARNLAAVGQVTFIAAKSYLDQWNQKRYPLEYKDQFGPASAVEDALVPFYDGDTPTSWETCTWRPKLREVNMSSGKPVTAEAMKDILFSLVLNASSSQR
jgi:hypothetical protein